jgi:MSHA biogenesis protein MshP
MRPDITSAHKRQTGLGLISAIFVIVVLAMLVVGMSGIMTASQTYRSQEILAVRALSAAQTGSELHLSELLHPDNTQVCITDASPVTLTTPGLLDCSYQSSCASVVVGSNTYYTIKSVGRCGSGVDSATREVKVRVAP